ncbi:MAG: hypothetical protein ACH34X_04135 [Thiolinea sp.]
MRNNSFSAIEYIKNIFPHEGIIHYISNQIILHSNGYCLNTFELDESLRKKTILVKRFYLPRIIQRILRRGIHRVISNGKNIFVLYDKKIAIFDLETQREIHNINIKGSRPLGLVNFQDGIIYGEYRNNQERTPVSLWNVTKDGTHIRLDTIENVRHIHTVTYWQETDCYYVTTGDAPNESNIIEYTNDFSKKRIILSGTDEYRIVQPIFRGREIYFCSDKPNNINYAYKYNIDTQKLEQLGKIGATVFYGLEKNGKCYFGTVAEPSKINESKYVELIMINENNEIIRLHKYKKDIWPHKLAQYGQIIFPLEDKTSDDILLYTVVATHQDNLIMRHKI